jgi:hypothetical protein
MSARPPRLPLVILAGSDPGSQRIPPGLAAGDLLSGHKAMTPLPNGKPLIGELIARYGASGRFERPLVVGPVRRFAPEMLGCDVVDAEGDLAATLGAAVAAIRERFTLATPIAISASDILPTADEIVDLLAASYDPVRECAFWGELVAAEPHEMGASAWKPAYRMGVRGGSTMSVYPGHLVILRPQALRIDVVIRLLHLAYQNRNQSLLRRMVGIHARGIGVLVRQDLANLRRGQAPTLALTIPIHSWVSYFRYRRRRLTVEQFERVFTRTFVHRDHHRTAGGRPTVFSLTRTLSFAKDLDTKAELEEAIGRRSCVSA